MENKQDVLNGVELMKMESQSCEWLITNMIPKGVVVLSGNKFTGKSFLALNLGLAVAGNGTFLGKTPAQQGEVLYLGLHDTWAGLQRRLRTMVPDMPEPPVMQFHIEWPQSSEGGSRHIESWLDKNPQARLVVIDPFQEYCLPRKEHLYENINFAGRKLQDFAKKYDVCILIVAFNHFDDGRYVGILNGVADACLEIEKEHCSEKVLLQLTGRDMPNQKFDLKRNKERLIWELDDTADPGSE